jgi:hypothetical protein
MKKRSLLVRILAIANALLITAAFVGCPARKDPNIITNPIAAQPGQPVFPTIAPPQIVPPPIATPPPPPFVTIAPYGGNFQHLLPSEQPPAPASQDSKNDKRSP